MDWKAFSIRLVETLRWPAVFLTAFFLVHGAVGKLIAAVAAKIGS